jgi:hypothetical protein
VRLIRVGQPSLSSANSWHLSAVIPLRAAPASPADDARLPIGNIMIKRPLSRIRDQSEATTGPEALRLMEQARAKHAETEGQFAAARAAYQTSTTAADEGGDRRARRADSPGSPGGPRSGSDRAG